MSKVVKNGRSKKYAIDGKKLAKALEKKGLAPRELSTALAFHPGYLNKCIRTNTIGEHAIGMLMNYGIAPSKYDAEILAKEKTVKDIFDSLPEETKEEVYSEVGKAVEEAEKLEQIKINPDGSHSLKDISKNPCERCVLRDEETNGPSDCASCRYCKENPNTTHPLNRNSGRYQLYDEKSPAEEAMEEPGVVKLEFTIDIVKLKAIVKQAVKEAYEEL